ncbi:TonB-dependent receptor [Altererythrobacter sp.]|uniref:TonB-dependent receptor n=1 Tax=Altererythrobacter sp. TaxID=1872480 RepID=UPI003D046E9E
MSLAAVCISGLTFAQVAQAQDEETSAEERNAIVVTGSRIAGVAPVGATVTTLGREEIETAGQVTLDKMIQELPQVFDLGFSDNSRAQNGGNGNATWSNSINLRGLGPFSTLIISDGHRMTTNGRAISPSVLPTLGVERVEVIADGASAIYGSDAVAGVVNLIPRRNLDGVEAFARLGSTGNGDFWEWNAGIAIGKVFDRGQVMVAYEHAFRSNLNGADRDFNTSDLTPWGGPDYRVNQCSPGTLIYGGQTYAMPAQLTAANADTLQAGTQNLCDPLAAQDLFPEQKYNSVNGTATFEITENVELLFDGYYNKRKFVRIPGEITRTFSVPETNAFFVAPSFYTPGSGGYQIGYNFVNEAGRDPYGGYQTSWQATPGLRVYLPADWKFEGKFGFGKGEDRAGSSSGLSLPAFNAAIASSDPATAFDPYGLGRTAPSTVSTIFVGEGTFPLNSKMSTWQAGVDGSLFSLPGGDVKMAAGYEGQDFTMILSSGLPDERTYNRKVHSGYAELLIPLFGPDNATSGFQSLEVTAALRYDDYSDVGSTTNPKFGVNWVPTDGVKLRGSYGTSFRAPTFPEIFGNSSRLYVQNHQNPSGGAALPVFKIGSGPNPDLQPETATTWTIGADFEPVDGLEINLTYFDIAYKNTIAGLLSNLSILTYADQYAGTDVILFGKEAYDRIIDIRDNGIAGTGPIPVFPIAGASTACLDNPMPPDHANCIYADGRSRNLGRSKMNGIDFNARYRTFVGEADTLTFALNGTYLTTYDVAFTPGGEFVSLKNRIYNPLTFKARGSVTWDHGPFMFRTQVQHIGGYKNDIVDPVEDVDSYTLVDLTFSWKIADSFDLGFVDGLTLGLEVRNLFDTDPPYVNSRQGQNSGGGYDPSVTNPIGREFAISLRSKF